MKILIVDDNKNNIYMLEALLSGNGYEIVTAFNGQEALDLLHRQQIDLIISDILMPVMDGYQLCREVKQDHELCKIPFIFYTATYTDPQDKKLALSLGADRFIVKPAEPEGFLNILNTLIHESESGLLHPEPPKNLPSEDIFKLYNERKHSVIPVFTR